MGRVGPRVRAVFAASVILGAVLLFVVQPMAGRLLLPPFGGTPAVWTTCLAFFQTALFAGYAWAHVASRYLPWRLHVVLHVGLLAFAVASLPFRAPEPPPGEGAAVLAVLAWLVGEVGAPFVALAATAPLLQSWYAATRGAEPYALYAWSNAGSLLALVLYPLAIEPALALGTQGRVFSAGLIGFSILVTLLGAAVFHRGCEAAPPAPVSWFARLSWLVLSALPSLLLVAVTTYITVDVAGGPLLWMPPLVIYLTTFVLVFARRSSAWLRPGSLPRTLALGAWAVSTVGLGINLFLHGKAQLGSQLLVALGVLFAGALLCHGELARRRPAAGALTSFYVWMAAGGALGGALGGLVAPIALSGFLELPICVCAIYVTLVLCHRGPRATRAERRWLLLGLGAAVPLAAANLWLQSALRVRDAVVVARRRGFFGLVQVTRFPEVTVMTHGRIRHGMQFNDANRRDEPTLYFGRETAIARVFAGPPLRVAVLGLGVGTLAAYGRVGDQLTFFEIDPDVAELARRHFTFLANTKARVDVAIGDGRRLLARERGVFDVMVLDAFSSDAVPMHLLTTEAFGVYLRHLAPDGILVANVSNRHLGVDRVVAGSARHHGLALALGESHVDRSRGVLMVRWALMARDVRALDRVLGGVERAPPGGSPVVWTDDHASVWPIVK
jgi:SAM-dependent methyltransferase